VERLLEEAQNMGMPIVSTNSEKYGQVWWDMMSPEIRAQREAQERCKSVVLVENDRSASSKFQIHTMTFGSIEDYCKGLQGRTGEMEMILLNTFTITIEIVSLFALPTLLLLYNACSTGAPHYNNNCFKAMKAEHCIKHGCNYSFVTPNYSIKTTPRREWGLVVEGENPTPEELKCD
jgi:hypothetical protein